MPESKKRQRKHEKPLEELLRAIRADIKFVGEQLGWPVPAEFARGLEEEVLRLSDPFYPGYFEAPIPSHRGDLRRHFISFHFIWEPGDPPVEEICSPWLMPIPTEEPWTGDCPPWHPRGPDYDDSVRAFRSLRKRKGLST